jgi:prophage regulatory protein
MRILDRAALKTEKGIRFTDVHLRRLEIQGRFPKRIHIGENRIGWVEAEVDQYIRDRMAERDDPNRPLKPRGKPWKARQEAARAKAAAANTTTTNRMR